jgi:hypothetical protein
MRCEQNVGLQTAAFPQGFPVLSEDLCRIGDTIDLEFLLSSILCNLEERSPETLFAWRRGS